MRYLQELGSMLRLRGYAVSESENLMADTQRWPKLTVCSKCSGTGYMREKPPTTLRSVGKAIYNGIAIFFGIIFAAFCMFQLLGLMHYAFGGN